jgi:hypothetical protein
MAAGPLIAVVTVVGTLAQPDGFDVIEDPTSDVGADTANLAWFSNLVGSVVPGLLLLVFAYGLWPWLASSRSGRIGTFLIGAVATGTVVTGLATEDCRAMDPGCSNDSSEVVVHSIAALVLAISVLVSPFVVARSLRNRPAWEDLRRVTLVLGVITVVGTVAGSAIGVGLGAYAAVVPYFVWLFVLAQRLHSLAARSGSPARA